MESKSVFGRPAPGSPMWKSLEKARRQVAAQEQAELQARYGRVQKRRVDGEPLDIFGYRKRLLKLFEPNKHLEKHRRRLLRAVKAKKN